MLPEGPPSAWIQPNAELKPIDVNENNRFRILHISSSSPNKGIIQHVVNKWY